MELVLRLGAQRAEDATGCKQRGAQPLGALPKRRALTDGPSVGHALERSGWDALGVPGKRCWRCQVELLHLLPHLPRDERDGRLHFRHDALGFLDAFSAALAEPCVRGHGAHLLEVSLDVRGDQRAVSTHPALAIDTRIGVANAAEALGDLFALRGEVLVLTTGRFEHLLGVLQVHACLWGPARPALLRLVTRAWRVGLHPFELLPGFGDGLVCRPLLRGHGTGDRFDQLVLYMEHVR